MDIYNIHNSLEYVSYSGNTIGVEQNVILKHSLVALQKENKLKKVYFWGKIAGLRYDYFVSCGYEDDALKDMKYYYSINCKDWGLMPMVTPQTQYLTTYCSTRFQGDPALQLDIKEDLPPTEPAEKEMPFTTTLKEEDRLAATVHMISDEAAIIPRGALRKREDGSVVHNPLFKGLTKSEASQLKYYLHLRDPQEKWTKNLLVHPDYNYALDFLDNISEDIPQGCWTMQFEGDCQLAILRNLKWPGMTFYHRYSSPDFGFLYFGHGKYNIDILFMS